VKINKREKDKITVTVAKSRLKPLGGYLIGFEKFRE
jgi:hypothetical protein